ncbi:MAG: hypothetical protein NTW95_10600 [Candidatus Aminicenantes bacterium]|nr:hypothetical protein [Candidatus Aminicenantes bacterium]
MTKKITAALSALSLLLVLSLPVYSADQDFTLVNATGVTIDEVYVSPVSAKDWQEDVLGEDVLEDGEKVDISFSRDEEVCAWDIMVKDTEGTEIYWRNIDLCAHSRITLHCEKDKVWATFE